MRTFGEAIWGHTNWVGVPESIAIRCPRCKGEASVTASFELLKKEQYEGLPKHMKEGCLRFGRAMHIRERFPETFRWTDSENPVPGFYPKAHDTFGVLACSGCATRKKHKLIWPNEAYYQIQLGNGVLWAWNRAHFIAMRDFLSSPNLHAPKGFGYFLKHIPKQFLLKRNRDRAVKHIERLLSIT